MLLVKYLAHQIPGGDFMEHSIIRRQTYRLVRVLGEVGAEGKKDPNSRVTSVEMLGKSHRKVPI
jgi:hypothetical protein